MYFVRPLSTISDYNYTPEMRKSQHIKIFLVKNIKKLTYEIARLICDTYVTNNAITHTEKNSVCVI